MNDKILYCCENRFEERCDAACDHRCAQSEKSGRRLGGSDVKSDSSIVKTLLAKRIFVDVGACVKSDSTSESLVLAKHATHNVVDYCYSLLFESHLMSLTQMLARPQY